MTWLVGHGHPQQFADGTEPGIAADTPGTRTVCRADCRDSFEFHWRVYLWSWWEDMQMFPLKINGDFVLLLKNIWELQGHQVWRVHLSVSPPMVVWGEYDVSALLPPLPLCPSGLMSGTDWQQGPFSMSPSAIWQVAPRGVLTVSLSFSQTQLWVPGWTPSSWMMGWQVAVSSAGLIFCRFNLVLLLGDDKGLSVYVLTWLPALLSPL